MAQKGKKGNSNLHITESGKGTRRKAKNWYKRKYLKHALTLGMVILAVSGTFLLLAFQEYSRARDVKTYEYNTSDSNELVQFGDGIVRYNGDGVVYLDSKGRQLWNQACQMRNPVMVQNDDAFVIADRGGSSIQVFTKVGLKGEMETTMPIEMVTVSNQGIVAALLQNENTPKIMCYDAAGNVLVEHSVTANSSGYPINMSIAKDGKLLLVSYLSTKDGNLSSRIVYYNFDAVGQDETDNAVTEENYADEIVPTTFFMDEETSAIVGDSTFRIYKGTQIPELSKEVNLGATIKSTFHTNKYIGFVLNKSNASENELRIYRTNGSIVLSKTFTGSYAHAKMVNNEVFLYDGTKCCIITLSGIQRFKGDVSLDITDIMPITGINKYLVISTREMKSIHLAK
ncbi:MAG: DUF5711 family protein [Hespellia sp.]|nr:DUF5711 family protein [Hespellia sp.]